MEFRVSINSIEAFAAEFWKYVSDARLFAFHGQMGAGKTTLVSALCHYKGTLDATSSPTFSIINEYRYVENNLDKLMYHIDLYRLNNEQEVIQAGVEECIYSGNICMVEWPEKSPFLFGEDTVHVYIEPISETERSVRIKLPSSL